MSFLLRQIPSPRCLLPLAGKCAKDSEENKRSSKTTKVPPPLPHTPFLFESSGSHPWHYYTRLGQIHIYREGSATVFMSHLAQRFKKPRRISQDLYPVLKSRELNGSKSTKTVFVSPQRAFLGLQPLASRPTGMLASLFISSFRLLNGSRTMIWGDNNFCCNQNNHSTPPPPFPAPRRHSLKPRYQAERWL